MAITFAILLGSLFGGITGLIAAKRNRGAGRWFAAGFFLGVLGILLALVVPSVPKQEQLPAKVDQGNETAVLVMIVIFCSAAVAGIAAVYVWGD